MVWYYYGTTAGMYGPEQTSEIHSAKSLTAALAGAYRMLKYGSFRPTMVLLTRTKTYRKGAIEYTVTEESPSFSKNPRVYAVNGKKETVSYITSGGHIKSTEKAKWM